MKLSIQTCALNEYRKAGLSRGEMLQAIRDCGFSCVDYDLPEAQVGDDYERQAEETRRLLKETGLTATMAHAPIINPLEPGEKDPVALYTRSLRFCQIAGIPRMVVHPGAVAGNSREAFFSANAAFYRSLIPAMEETGVQVMTENIGNYADPYYLWNGAAVRELVEKVDHPLMKVCWDVGHANHFSPEDCDQYDSIVALGDCLAGLHVHENLGYFSDTTQHHRIDMHTMPYASVWSCLNYDAVLQGLKDVNYSGTFNFEVIMPTRAWLRRPFVYKGEMVERLALPPLKVWVAFNKALYEMGRFMLEEYGLYEE